MFEEEQWRTVAGFPDYRVSDQGRVASYRRKKPHIMQGSRNQRGYLMVHLRDGDGNITVRTVHRLVGETFLGPLPEGLQTRHLDGNKDNCAVTNLAYGSQSDNELDKVRHGRHNMARKTHCPAQHPYDETNTRVSSGRRYCRTCARDRRTSAALRAASVPTERAA